MKKIITAILSITGILNTTLYAAVSGPYTVDAYTLHLYHFDGNANDAVAVNPINLTLANGATVTAASYTGFGTLLNTYEGTSGTGNMPIAYVNEKAVNNFFGTDGAFTFEAIIRPFVAITAIPNAMEIISGDDDTGQTRGWMFRVTAAGRLEFTKLTGTQETFLAALPTTGEQAWGLEGFHVAVTYNGLENTPNNLKFYWSRLNSSTSQAVLLASFQMVTDLSISAAVDFAVGNDGRDNANENFEGLVDEVRISSIARAPDQMLVIPSVPCPIIVTHPSDTMVKEPQTASFQTVFESASTPIVQWFKVDPAGDIELTPGDPDIAIQFSYDSGSLRYTTTLTISNTSPLDTGSYYCRINNDSGLPRNSNTAELVVQGLVAHWTLDLADFVSGQYQDVIGGYDAAAQGTPTFAAGADGSANGAVVVTPATGWAAVTGFNPGTTGQLTVSLWVNWQETSVSSDDLTVTSLPNGNSVSVSNGLKSANHWQQVCAVFDGTIAKVYINGKLQAQGACPLPADMTSLLNIGSANQGEEAFNGGIDDLKIYNYAMTDMEVADVYHAMTGLGVCLLNYASQFDFTGPDGQPDCTVDIYDLRVFANNWLTLYDYPEFMDLSKNWLSCGLYPNCNP